MLYYVGRWENAPADSRDTGGLRSGSRRGSSAYFAQPASYNRAWLANRALGRSREHKTGSNFVGGDHGAGDWAGVENWSGPGAKGHSHQYG